MSTVISRISNYFRDFVPNDSNVVNPLNKMIDYYASKQAKLTWTGGEGEGVQVVMVAHVIEWTIWTLKVVIRTTGFSLPFEGEPS
jgi:hypothetical protein